MAEPIHKTGLSRYPDPDLFKIEPSYIDPHFLPHGYLSSIQEIVNCAIPESFLADSLFHEGDRGSLFYRLSKFLPIVRVSTIDRVLPITFILPAEYTHGAGRYITDTLSRWLIPGKNLPLIGQISLNFRFAAYPVMTFFVLQQMVGPIQECDVSAVHTHLPTLIQEMKVKIAAVCHARYLTSLRSSQEQHKNMIIEEVLSGVLQQKADVDCTLYDQMQMPFAKINTEEKIDTIKKNISSLLAARPKTFDRSAFHGIHSFFALFKDAHSSLRCPKHLSRIIAYHYLFKKFLGGKVRQSPHERHLSIKVLRTTLANPDSIGLSSPFHASEDRVPSGEEPIVAVLFGFNLLKDTERFDLKHLMEVIQSCVPTARCLPDSVVVDRRDERLRFFYFELSQEALSHQDIKVLKTKLSQEIIRQIENVVHPVFLPRNDEELMRNLIVLSHQIKYKRDLPQVSIHYDMQSTVELTFTVSLVRLLLPASSSLNELLQKASPTIRCSIDDIHITGYLKSKYPKEAATLRISLDKAPFFRSDYSIDLLRARQRLSVELKTCLGEFRDFNGGMILKQDEALSQLRLLLDPLSQEQELLLGNYFYSLRPALMQTIYDPSILKAHFALLLKAIGSPLAQRTHQMVSLQKGNFYLCWIQAVASSFQTPLMEAITALQLPSHTLAMSVLPNDCASHAWMGIIVRAKQRKEVAQVVRNVLSRWKCTASC